MRRIRFDHFAWGLLAYNLLVVAWGAYVRATGSGDGCGSHWPHCNGAVIPLTGPAKTFIEFSHRATSGVLGLLVLVLLVWARRLFPAGTPVRRAAAATFGFTCVEALIGAALVKFGWVARDDSAARAVVMAVHLCTTFLLLAATALTAYWAGGGRTLRLAGQGSVSWSLGAGLAGILLLGISGAVTALGDTLYPVRDSLDAIREGLSPGAHFLVKLRIWHPLLAASVCLYLILVSGLVIHLRPSAHVRRFAAWTGAWFLAQIALGFVNVLLRAPVWMQMIHLVAADLIWISAVLMAAAALSEGVLHVEQLEPAGAEPRRPDAPAPARATCRDYLWLTKPRVISLLLFTTLAAAFIAAGGWPGTGLLLAVTVGGYMSAGAANTINMVLERDLDLRMKRTAGRPTVSEVIPPPHALAFGFVLAALSFAVLWWGANLLAAVVSLAGLVFYVVIYTLLLKRRTWQNIVIGGAAGAFPPLVGWAAVQNDLSLLAWWLFAIIFVWTPVHFWALALLIKEDYARAGVPMLPVVRGDRATVNQIGIYALLTSIISVAPLVQQQVGTVYLVAAAGLNVLLLQRALRLYRDPGRPRAAALYKFSMLYLALLFLGMAVDRSIAAPPVAHAAPGAGSGKMDKNILLSAGTVYAIMGAAAGNGAREASRHLRTACARHRGLAVSAPPTSAGSPSGSRPGSSKTPLLQASLSVAHSAPATGAPGV